MLDTLQTMLNLGVAGFAVFLFYRLTNYVITSNTAALHKLGDAIEQLTHHIKEH